MKQELIHHYQPVAKRRAALLRSRGRLTDAVNALTSLLDMSPTDAESWAELADLYLAHGLYSQAIFAQEEVLVLQPNAWNVSLILYFPD
jgi:ER membrane protein complex subunit 2